MEPPHTISKYLLDKSHIFITEVVCRQFKSMKRPLVGFLAKSVGSIPVRRPQDEAIKGEGKVTAVGNVVKGVGTKFTTSGARPDLAILETEENSLLLYLFVLLDSEITALGFPTPMTYETWVSDARKKTV